MAGVVVLACLVVALSLTMPSAAAHGPRSRISAFGFIMCLHAVMWPTATGARFGLVPLPFAPGSCATLQVSSVGMFLISSVTSAHIALEWQAEDERVIARFGHGGWVLVSRGFLAAISLVIADGWITYLLLTGQIVTFELAVATMVFRALVHSAWVPLAQAVLDAIVPGAQQPGGWDSFFGWLATSRSRRGRCRTTVEVVSEVVLMVRIASMVMIVTMMVVFGTWPVCSAWNRLVSQADPPAPFPAGLDAGAKDTQELFFAMAVLDAGFNVAAFGNMLGPAVSMTLQLQLGLTAARTAQQAKADRQLLHAVTYVSHHTRGPLNAAVLCLAVLQDSVAMLALGSFAAAAGARREARKLLPHDPKGSGAVSSSGLVSASASAEPSASPSVQVAVSVVAAVGDLGRPPTFEAVPPPAGAGPAVAGELVVEVRYDGDGFDAAQLLERDPFEPFDRSGAASSTTATAEDLLSGDGLRLAVLRGVATSLHGEAGVASGGRHDDATVLRVERRLLERWGARVEGFADGADVVARLRELQTTGGRFPDTLVIDSQMPRLDGLATVRALRAMGRGVAWGQAVDATGRRVGGDERWSASGPLLVLATGESSRPLEAEARGLGVREVLVKPLRADRLLEGLTH
ncbi:hypothetical protein FNF28_03366 [Cafeteria roenbergensis]|uniref:Response regulatory domain-containing protein n=1 Tax=Cafeteria roenbergensis TaxID=33653 RepID=A0A5A8DPM2_CAFRO|nr:hypothetical protein FNF28_03366 [Cafeteria roenbergensis]